MLSIASSGKASLCDRVRRELPSPEGIVLRRLLRSAVGDVLCTIPGAAALRCLALYNVCDAEGGGTAETSKNHPQSCASTITLSNHLTTSTLLVA